MPLCVIGPQTNIAEALKREPAIADKARFVSMAGSVHIGYKGNEEPQPEWNVLADVFAARAVFGAPWSITLDPLDVCGNLRLEGELYKRMEASENPLAQVIMENYAAWVHRDKYSPDESSVLFDTVAAYMSWSEDLLKVETLPLSIDAKGMTVPDKENGRPVRCALEWKDRAAFEQLLVERLTQ